MGRLYNRFISLTFLSGDFMKSVLWYGQLTKAKKAGQDVGVTRLHAAALAIKDGYKIREFERVARPNGLTFIRKRRIDTNTTH